MTEQFNGLSAAEAERLFLLAEEAAELIQAIGKILRHGYESYNPDKSEDGSNRDQLNRELGDLQFAMSLMDDAGDIHLGDIATYFDMANDKKWNYLHHHKAVEPAGLTESNDSGLLGGGE